MIRLALVEDDELYRSQLREYILTNTARCRAKNLP